MNCYFSNLNLNKIDIFSNQFELNFANIPTSFNLECRQYERDLR